MSKALVRVHRHDLPQVMDSTLSTVGDILSSFNLPREIIASNEEIEFAWRELPREISRIPVELRDGLIARMCVATSVGLFDGAINYMWNAVILNLRARARNFGLGYIAQTLNRKFEEEDLNELQDSELLELCQKLELLSQEGYFFLDQCRDIRNSFSVAHPSIAQIDDRELINFISRCCKHGISADYTLQGIQIAEFINSIKATGLSEDTIEMWCARLENTFPAQRVLLIPMLHGVYCDPSSKEHARINALNLCLASRELFDSKINSTLIEQHRNYLAKSEEDKIKASRFFFQKLNLVNLLDNTERHSIIRNACIALLNVHKAYNNFYNEPPFARTLYEITQSTTVPDTAKEEFVHAVLTCYIGNPYGVSRAAITYYEGIIANFSPKEIGIMLNIPISNATVATRIKEYANCKARYFLALSLINEDSFTPQLKARYEQFKKKL